MRQRKFKGACLALASGTVLGRLLMGCVLVCASMAHADQDPMPAGRLDLQLTVEHSQGLYGETALTQTRQTSVSARYRKGPWTLQLQVPWVDTRTLDERAVGLGDVWAILSWEARELTRQQTGIDLTLKLKTATGDVMRGLGSGGTDVAVQVEGSHLLGPVLVFGHLGHRQTGDVSGFAPYFNPWYAELGAQMNVGEAFTVGVYQDSRTPVGRRGSLSEFTAFGAWRQGAQRWQLDLTRGFQPASPQWAAGLTLRSRF